MSTEEKVTAAVGNLAAVEAELAAFEAELASAQSETVVIEAAIAACDEERTSMQNDYATKREEDQAIQKEAYAGLEELGVVMRQLQAGVLDPVEFSILELHCVTIRSYVEGLSIERKAVEEQMRDLIQKLTANYDKKALLMENKFALIKKQKELLHKGELIVIQYDLPKELPPTNIPDPIHELDWIDDILETAEQDVANACDEIMHHAGYSTQASNSR